MSSSSNNVYGKNLQQTISTPQFCVNLHTMRQNCEKMLLEAQASQQVSVRPHIKTHKTLEAFLFQSFGNTIVIEKYFSNKGFDIKQLLNDIIDNQQHSYMLLPLVVSTLGEAEFLLDAAKQYDGLLRFDIVYGVPFSGVTSNLSPKWRKIQALVKETTTTPDQFTLMFDSVEAIHLFINQFLKKKANPQWNVMMQIDCGYGRAGLPTDEQATLDALILLDKFCTLRGLYTHAGHAYHAKTRQEVIECSIQECSAMNKFCQRILPLSVDIVGVGSTPTCSNPPPNGYGKWVNEIHPGNNVYYDLQQQSLSSCELKDIACFVLTSIVAHYPSRNQMLIDAGALALSKDQGGTFDSIGWALIKDHQHLKITSISQEVGIVKCKDPQAKIDFSKYPIGSTLKLLPHHSCLTAACFSNVVVVDNDDIILDVWKTAPRIW